ncbi:DUF1273 domain-containing protein [Lederbergia wuyishanensis]|uniref:UPF0398 protein J2S14_000810 n=1 Tax=Lederbergia wuyishanensis TaxID=1347903 RepID=A0ABU0D0T8_9BACI|nr:DUF1273 domain-containing protein [Lederbergia wuyishanensis]MCJ8006636.1 DUF1273 domain-containing protein [Lederbergia wuyishanensis]MDQ0342017.1 putative phage-like protein YoqJ [Lederbergia wuyishanensis]
MLKVATVTGYKPFELGIYKNNDPAVEYIKKALCKALSQLAEEGMEWVIISGQLGVELWAAEVVIDLIPVYPELKLGVITPFLNQEENWKEENKELYESVLMQADYVDSLSKQPYTDPWQFRNKNKFFVQKSDCALILYDVEKEGSPKFFFEISKQYQQSHPYEIRTIDFYDLQSVVEDENY